MSCYGSPSILWPMRDGPFTRVLDGCSLVPARVDAVSIGIAAKNQGVDLGAVSTILKNLIGPWRLSWNESRTAIADLSEQS